MPRHVKKGDTVIITAGDDKGRTGEVMRVITRRDQVIVKGLNLRTKHLKPSRINPQGGVITREAPIHISNVSPVVDGRATRVRFEVRPDGSKVRVAVRGGKTIDTIRKARPRSGASPAPQPSVKKTSRAERKAARAANA
jgi:large subunit ribosomal protein L24